MQISIKGLSKIYRGGNAALQDIDLEIGSGMFGLLGPNGAGKTTLMRILVTLLAPTSGEVTVAGHDLRRNRKQIRQMLGYLPQDFRFFSKLSTWEFLDYAAGLVGFFRKRDRDHAVDEMLERVRLFDVRDRAANKLSGGMKRRLGIAQALIGNPRILVVDEPTTGLDPEERIRFRNVLADLGSEERIILLSTHIVGDISSTCENVALLDEGKLVFRGSPDELIDVTRGHVYRIQTDESQLEAIAERFAVIATIPASSGWEVTVVAEDLTGFDGEPVEPNLEHAYVYYLEHEIQTGKGVGNGQESRWSGVPEGRPDA